MDHFFEFDIDAGSWGKLKLLRVLSSEGDPWGVLAPIRDTSWSVVVNIINGEDLSQALHGYAMPLIRSLGDHPKRRAWNIPKVESMCALMQDGSCTTASKECRPGGDGPHCYTPPGAHSLPVKVALNRVVRALSEGRFIVIVEGDEFII